MNFSKFSKNKLNKEQMMAVKGGECPRGEDGHQHCINKLKDGRCYESVGESILNRDGTWGWQEYPGGHYVQCPQMS